MEVGKVVPEIPGQELELLNFLHFCLENRVIQLSKKLPAIVLIPVLIHTAVICFVTFCGVSLKFSGRHFFLGLHPYQQ